MPGEIHAIVNPAAGAWRTRRRWPRIAAKLEAIGSRVHSHVTRGAGDATMMVSRLLRAGVREILAVGGDGTANEVANGFFCNGRPIATDAVLSVMPTGTGHDFARSLGIRSETTALATLAAGQLCRIDVGIVEYRAGGTSGTRCFVNAADVGLGAAAAGNINRSRKLLGGRLTYLLGAVRAILSFQPSAAQVLVDNAIVSDGPVEMVLIANGRFHAGGMRMAPMAQMSDGAFEILILKRVSKLTLLTFLLPRAYRGAHVGHPAVQHVRGHEVQVRAAAALLFEMDGEQPGTTDLCARVLSQAIVVRVPDRLTGGAAACVSRQPCRVG